jgi:uncharacterized protein YjiS (DUF1127 family)
MIGQMDETRAAGRRIGRPRTQAWVPRLLVLLAGWRERARQRRALARLDDHLLRDIGISRGEAQREASRWPWLR